MQLPFQSQITSDQNPHYKRWRRFIQRPADAGCPWIPIEGVKQISDLSRNRTIELMLLSSSSAQEMRQLARSAADCVLLPDRLFSKLSKVQSPQGAIAFFSKPTWSWDELTPWLIYLYEVQDPGNLGTLLRTAAATGLFSIVSSPGTVSFFNDKVIRASAGCLFSVPFLEGLELAEIEGRGFECCVASPHDGPAYFDVELAEPIAFILSNEGHGLDSQEVEGRLRPVRIPMQPGVESLNVAVSGSLIMYEIVRRRSSNG